MRSLLAAGHRGERARAGANPFDDEHGEGETRATEDAMRPTNPFDADPEAARATQEPPQQPAVARTREAAAVSERSKRVLEEASRLQAQFGTLDEALAKVKAAYDQLPFEASSSGAATLRPKMADDIAAATSAAASMRKRVDKLREDAAGEEQGSPTARQASMLADAFQRRLAAFLGQLGALKKLARDREARLLERRAYAAFGERLAAGEADKLLDSAGVDGGAAVELMLRQAVHDAPQTSGSRQGRTATALAEVRGAHADADQRLSDAMALEQSLNELYQMFLDMAALVDAQGDELNSIAKNVESSIDYTRKGNVEVARAKHLQKSVLRKRCCFWVAVALTIAVVVLIVLLMTALL